MKPFIFEQKEISSTSKPYIIAEIAQAHDGSLGAAHAYIDACARAGADAVKFQTHYAAEESTPDEPWRVKFSKRNETRFEYWQRMEFTDEEWQGLKAHADEVGIDFISTPFSNKAISLLSSIDVPFWKISSGEINNIPLLNSIIATKKPVILSSGMSPIEEVDNAVEMLCSNDIPFVVLQCTTAYPCPADKVGLNNLEIFSSRYNCPVGLSDHSGKVYSSLAAIALGASVIEVHVVFDKQMFGPDTSSSLTFPELEMLIEGANDIHTMRLNPVDKNEIAKNELQGLRSLFNKSIVIANDVEKGTVLTESHVAFKKPGTGIPSNRLDEVLNRAVKYDLKRDHMLDLQDLEEQ